MTRNPDLKDTSPRFTAKILWTPLALAGWLVSANCGTLATTQVGTSDDDLSTSYAVKSLSQEPAGSKP